MTALPQDDTLESAADLFEATTRDYLNKRPLEMYFPNDLNRCIDPDPRDSTGFWVNAKIWIDFVKLQEFGDLPEDERDQDRPSAMRWTAPEGFFH